MIISTETLLPRRRSLKTATKSTPIYHNPSKMCFGLISFLSGKSEKVALTKENEPGATASRTGGYDSDSHQGTNQR